MFENPCVQKLKPDCSCNVPRAVGQAVNWAGRGAFKQPPILLHADYLLASSSAGLPFSGASNGTIGRDHRSSALNRHQMPTREFLSRHWFSELSHHLRGKHFASSYRWIELLPSQGGRGNTIPGFWLPQACAGTCGKAFSPGRLAAYTTSSSSNLQAVRKIHHMKAATAVQPVINYPQVNRLNLIEQITTAAGRLAPSPSSPCTVGILDEGC